MLLRLLFLFTTVYDLFKSPSLLHLRNLHHDSILNDIPLLLLSHMLFVLCLKELLNKVLAPVSRITIAILVAGLAPMGLLTVLFIEEDVRFVLLEIHLSDGLEAWSAALIRAQVGPLAGKVPLLLLLLCLVIVRDANGGHTGSCPDRRLHARA